MSEVLIDLYSIFSFGQVFNLKAKGDNFCFYSDIFQLIENLILCEKIIVDRNGVYYHRLNNICSIFSDSIRYIEDNRLYETTSEGTVMKGEDIYKRGLVYADIAKENNIYYSPHPDREKILTGKIESCIDRTAVSIVKQFDQKINESKSGIISNINVKIPPVAEHVLYFSKTNRISISESINEIRNSKNAVRFRDYFNKLDLELMNLSPRKKIPVHQKLFQDIDNLCNAWTENMDTEVRFRKRKINLTKIPLLGVLLESVGIEEISIADPIIFPKDPYLLFINDLYQK